MNSIEDAITAAQQAAASVGSQAAGALATAPTAAPVAARGAPLSMDAMMSAGMAVDAYLRVKEDVGISIGADKRFFPTIKFGLVMSEAVPCEVIKFGNPATYLKTYDGVTESRGGPWSNALITAQKVDPKAQPYRSADIPLVALEPIIGKDNKTVLLEKGQKAGISLSTTNWKNWQTFWGSLKARNVVPSDATVIVELGFENRRNAAGNEWAVFTFTLVEVVPDLDAYLADGE